ncbi:MAG: hypothetical protein GWP58_15000 [Gammaproteobacteria bacterium]|nr:hypothetical protein [Gammaproteobacteria bacterium]
MNPAFSEFMESSCLALAREVPEFPTQMGMFEIAGESVPQDYFTGIDAGSVARRQQLLLNIGKQLNRFSHEDLNESEQLSAGVLDFLVNYVHERGLIGRAGKDFLQHEYLVRPNGNFGNVKLPASCPLSWYCTALSKRLNSLLLLNRNEMSSIQR